MIAVGRNEPLSPSVSASAYAVAGMTLDWSLTTQFPRLKTALAFWNAKLGTELLPKRSAINPLELREILPFIQLYDILDASGTYRVRLIGSEIARHFPSGVTGTTFDGTNVSPLVQRMIKVLSLVTEKREPLIARVERSTIDPMDYAAVESIYLPFTDDGERVSVVMSATVMFLPQQLNKIIV